ncbi:hypothetical protein PGT21_032185 [Puccinia graminis f. sp. tritici]|uniref:Uncharacterized protein n=1 Tax=Puccinia graminis f. sp. tritici TaxID=56615 RepID=A0A5B0PB80_PUCGR|nr:hypothetical protein PGT21_032185 [Puccinia graminis f. sp. tritici]
MISYFSPSYSKKTRGETLLISSPTALPNLITHFCLRIKLQGLSFFKPKILSRCGWGLKFQICCFMAELQQQNHPQHPAFTQLILFHVQMRQGNLLDQPPKIDHLFHSSKHQILKKKNPKKYLLSLILSHRSRNHHIFLSHPCLSPSLTTSLKIEFSDPPKTSRFQPYKLGRIGPPMPPKDHNDSRANQDGWSKNIDMEEIDSSGSTVDRSHTPVQSDFSNNPPLNKSRHNPENGFFKAIAEVLANRNPDGSIYCVLKNAWTDSQDLHLKILDFHYLKFEFLFYFFLLKAMMSSLAITFVTTASIGFTIGKLPPIHPPSNGPKIVSMVQFGYNPLGRSKPSSSSSYIASKFR